jgi:hypothetical protein
MARTGILNAVRVKTLIFLCSSRLSKSSSTYKMQLASMWSISCNIQHLAHQYCQHRTQLKKNLLPLPAAKYGKSTKRLTLQHHQANKRQSSLEEAMV